MSIILVKNGLVYDGSGERPKKTDILIRQGRIVRLGHFPKKNADLTIDAAGAMICPGFIDTNSSFDHDLDVFNSPGGEPLIRSGITTALGGNCGASLAPVFGDALLSLRKWGDISKLNVGWRGFSDLLKTLEKRGLGVNFGTLVGHGTVRRGILGENFRDLTDRELAVMKKFVEESLREGAFGVSFGLEYAHARLTPYAELLEISKIAARLHRPAAVHLRDYGAGLEAAVRETIKLAKDSGASVEINHFEPLLGFRNEYVKAREAVETETAETLINFDCHAEGVVSIPIYQLLPPNLKKGSLEEMTETIRSAHREKEILEHFKKVVADEIIVASAPPPLRFLNGRNLRDFAANHDLKKEEALLKLMRLSRLRAVVFLKMVDEKITAEFLNSPSSFVSSGGTGRHDVFENFLRWANTNGLPLEVAVAKTTALPAAKFKIRKRGLIKEDYFADIVILRDFKVEDVIINGRVALEGGVFVRTPSGSVLRPE